MSALNLLKTKQDINHEGSKDITSQSIEKASPQTKGNYMHFFVGSSKAKHR